MYKDTQSGLQIENSQQLSWKPTLTLVQSLHNFNYVVYKGIANAYNMDYLFTIYSEKDIFLTDVLKAYWWDMVGMGLFFISVLFFAIAVLS